MEYNALGYSGTNSGGAIVINHSQFDNNQDGFDTNTQIAGDPPAPQNGACPNNGISPITHTHSCWVLDAQLDPRQQQPERARRRRRRASAPTGTGMTLSGGRNDTVMHNTFANNGAWGILFVPFPDSSTPEYGPDLRGHRRPRDVGPRLRATTRWATRCSATRSCTTAPSRTRRTATSGRSPSTPASRRTATRATPAPNGVDAGRPRADAADLRCHDDGANTGGPLLAQVLCDFGSAPCGPDMVYPQRTGVVMHPLPKGLPTMADPCSGVPDNAWCTGGKADLRPHPEGGALRAGPTDRRRS